MFLTILNYSSYNVVFFLFMKFYETIYVRWIAEVNNMITR